VLVFLLSFLMPKYYTSTAVLSLVSTEPSTPIGGLAGQLAGLAGLGGQITSSGAQPTVTLATLQARGFLVDFARRRELLPDLFPRGYDARTGTWSEGIPFGGAPTEDEIFDEMEDTVSVDQDTITGLVTVEVRARTPAAAQERATWLLRDLNDQLRARDIRDVERRIEFLNQQIAGTTVAELRQVLYHLIEDRMKTATLAHASEDYAVHAVDPPSRPDRQSQPKRIVLSVLAGVLSTLLVLAWIMARFAVKPYLPWVPRTD
jgi:uncharacterized protein involved in exopolysaccharide biosynthesis